MLSFSFLLQKYTTNKIRDSRDHHGYSQWKSFNSLPNWTVNNNINLPKILESQGVLHQDSTSLKLRWDLRWDEVKTANFKTTAVKNHKNLTSVQRSRGITGWRIATP